MIVDLLEIIQIQQKEAIGRGGGIQLTANSFLCAAAVMDAGEEVLDGGLLQEASVKDFLTGIHNRRGAEEAVRRQLDASTAPYGFLLLDLDDFKQINDHGGHITRCV